jgi:MFS family permease
LNATPDLPDRENPAARPSLYYGWTITHALGISEMTSWGILYYAFSVILTPLQAELGWAQSTITGAFSLALFVAGIAAVPVGRWVDQHGARLIMSAGSCAAVLLVLAWSQVTTVWGFYTVWFLIGLTSATVFYEPAFTVVANWFQRKRARALTVLTFWGGLASVIFVPLTEWLVRQVGWRPALLLLAGVLALVTIPLHALVLRRRPADIGLAPDGDPLPVPVAQPSSTGQPTIGEGERALSPRAAIGQAAFWWLAAAFSLSTLVVIAVSVHLIPYLIERGFSAAFAAATLALLGGSQIPGRLIFTPLGGYVSRRLLTAGLFAMQWLALLILIAVPSETGILIFAMLFGAGAGASTPARAALVAEMYGTRHYGSISGLLALVTTVARALGPVGMGVLYVVAGGYHFVLWTLVLIATGAVAAMLQVRAART